MRSHSLKELSLALIAARIGSQQSAAPEAVFLTQFLQRIGVDPAALPAAIQLALLKPCSEDARLVKLARLWEFSAAETLAVALTAAVEEDVMTGRAVAFAQAPLAASRPTLGLLSAAFGDLTENGYLTPGSLAGGPAVQSGMLVVGNDQAPFPERTVAAPIPLTLALADHESTWPRGFVGDSTFPVPLPETTLLACQRHAEALRTEHAPILVIRSASTEEARAAAAHVARGLKLFPFFANADVEVNGLAAWLLLRRMLPIFLLDAAPGESKAIPEIPFYRGPSLVISGVEGAFQARDLDVINWTLPMPNVDERAALWREALRDSQIAASLARAHRLGAARISQVGRLARHRARYEGRPALAQDLVIEALRSGEGSALESLAQVIPDPVPDEALVLCPEVRSELETLLARCRHRDGLAANLGISAATRYSPGVRALFTGPSGTGKTLAAGWLATQLGLPLYRVDLASVTSKYIGETEKNLARLLARAERSEALLLFDEADSLFGKRTDVREANDRFANAQTNYLLQRMETFDGIALLTSNSRARFDAAFARRLDVVIEFPPPAVAERRALWEAHLGSNHRLTRQEINLLAGQCDFAGGQIRNVVFAAAVAARENGGTLDFSKIIRSLAAEFRKAGRPPPPSLAIPMITRNAPNTVAVSPES